MNTMPMLLGACCASAALLAGCGGGGGSSPVVANPSSSTALAPPPPTPDIHIAVTGTAYEAVLVDCALAESPAESCPLTTLPLIGQDTNSPSVDDILARTAVSHDWMAIRLREVLQVLPADVLALMKGITAVVVTHDVRPSFFSPSSGAIFIDPAHLWLTNVEKATVAKDPDYRAHFGDALSFVSLYRYLAGTQYAWRYYDLDGTEVRAIRDIERRLAALLFHELAHANDALPPTEVPALDRSLSFAGAVAALADRRISAQLTAAQPLTSRLLMDLAEVLYHGKMPTVAQRNVSAAQVGLEFESDGANDDYAYSDEWEDLAMLFEEVMMRYHYGIDREVAYTNMPSGDDALYCDYYIVQWGARNRAGDPLVRARAEFGLQLLLDTADVAPYLDSVPSQWRMVDGRDWCSIQSRTASAGERTAQDTSAPQSSTAGRTRLRPDAIDRGYR